MFENEIELPIDSRGGKQESGSICVNRKLCVSGAGEGDCEVNRIGGDTVDCINNYGKGYTSQG